MKLNRKMLGLMVFVIILLVSTVSLAAPVEINIWSRGNPQYLEAYQAIEKMYMKQNPGVVIKHVLFADLEDKLLTAYMGGEAPDAWICDTVTTGRWDRYNMAAVIDPKTLPNSKYIIPSAWGTCKGADGKLYAVPWSVQAQAMYYRADWLKKLNLKVPTTWNEMINVAEAITTKDPDGNGKNDTYGIAVYGSTNRGYAYWTFQDWLWQAGGSVLKASKVKKGKWIANLNTSECKKALQFEKDMAFKYKVFQPGYLTAESSTVYGSFADGIAGMVFHAGYRILEYKARLGENLGTALMPAGPANAAVLGEGENIYISSATKKSKAVLNFANYMLSQEAQKFGLKNQISNVVRTSVRKDVDNMAVTGEPLMKAFVDAFQKHVRWPEAIPDYYPVKLLVSELVQKAITSSDSDLDALMKDYNLKVNIELQKQGAYSK